MPSTKKRINFYESTDGVDVKDRLKSMVLSVAYNTKSSYTANGNLYPDNLIPFVDKHMQYLSLHPTIDPYHYLANLRLITKLK